jgi:hypothetical protein
MRRGGGGGDGILRPDSRRERFMDVSRRSAIVALAVAGGLLACVSKPAVAPAGKTIALPFIENQFTAALAQARESHRPLFVEVWAPW